MKINVTISGKTYDGVSGGGLFQSEEYADIAQEFRQVRRGRGRQYKATLTFDQVARVERHLQGYGELFTGPGFDPGDRDTPAEGRACLKDAARMRAQLDAAEEEEVLTERAKGG